MAAANMEKFRSLGFTEEDYDMLTPAARRIITERNFRKPRTGIPPEWIQKDGSGKSGTSLLMEAASIGEETTQIGSTTVNQLHQQTEQLESADKQIGEIEQEAGRALTILHTMKMRLFREKCIAGTFIVALLAVNGFIAYELSQQCS